jgi:hypothetical protein
LGEEIKEFLIFQKVLRSLPMIFNPKISALEEREDLNPISMDELHGIFTAYEMRTEHENPNTKEASFKESKESKKKEKELSNNCDIAEYDEEVTNFVKRLKKETNDTYKGNIPLICFNYDGVGPFYNKFPHKKKINDEGYSNNKQTYKVKEPQRKFSRKTYVPKKTSHHQMKMKSVTVRQKYFYSWQ